MDMALAPDLGTLITAYVTFSLVPAGLALIGYVSARLGYDQVGRGGIGVLGVLAARFWIARRARVLLPLGLLLFVAGMGLRSTVVPDGMIVLDLLHVVGFIFWWIPLVAIAPLVGEAHREVSTPNQPEESTRGSPTYLIHPIIAVPTVLTGLAFLHIEGWLEAWMIVVAAVGLLVIGIQHHRASSRTGSRTFEVGETSGSEPRENQPRVGHEIDWVWWATFIRWGVLLHLVGAAAIGWVWWTGPLARGGALVLIAMVVTSMVGWEAFLRFKVRPNLQAVNDEVPGEPGPPG